MNESLCVNHLRFAVEAETAIELGAFKGSALRGAWQSHLRTLYCADRTSTDPLHATLCPVCYLLSREDDPRDNRRPYTFEPPLTAQERFAAGERFCFGITLFGSSIQFLPYIVLSVQTMGRVQGLGRAIHPTPPHRGSFRLVSIEEVNPLLGSSAVLFAAGEKTIRLPQSPVTAAEVARACEGLASHAAAHHGELTLDFQTPTRIIQQERLVHRPEFVPVMMRLADRIGALRNQFGAEPALGYKEKGSLLAASQRVQCVGDETRWWDVKGHSTRLDQPQPLGGFVGRATYRCDDWSTLLPWLVLGASTHVGKNAVKGNGWYRLEGLP